MKYAKVEQVSREEKFKDAKEKISQLREENKKLKDELDSLWLMMDEMKKSDIKNWSHLMKDLSQSAITKSLMVTNKKADC